MTLSRKWMPSPCYSGRDINGVRIIVLHTAEGATTIESLGNFFANAGNGVSSHTGADDKRGVIGEYVTRGNKAWTQANYNGAAVALELCGFAHWSRSVWLNQHENMLRNAADWIREESQRLGIPLTVLSDSAAQGGGRGVCQHINLGAGGGGHVDCGSGFPLDVVMQWARGESAGADDSDVMGEGMIYLAFDDGGTAALTFSNEEADGKHRVRVFCNRACDVEIDLATEKAEFGLGWDAGPQGLKIPAGVKKGAVRYITQPEQNAKIAFVVSESS